MIQSRAPYFVAAGLVSAAAFAFLARAVARRKTAPADGEIHHHTAAPPGHPARRAAEATSPVGKWWTYVPAAVAVSTYVCAARNEECELRARIAGSAAIAVAAAGAASLNHVFDDLLPQPPAPPGRPPRHPVFPSGHAFGTSAVALSAAYVLSRERFAPAAAAFPIAMLVPAASAVARLMEEKHWASDIVGGLIAAVAIASFPLAVYEAMRLPQA